MKLIYIAGRYRDSRGEYYVRCNIREAERCALFVWQFGGVAICPHKNTAGLGGAYNIPDEVWLNGDMEIMSRCDAVWAIPGWDTSEGAMNEVKNAKVWGLPVLYNQAEVLEYLGSEKKGDKGK